VVNQDFERLRLDASGLQFSALAAGKGSVVLCLHGFPDHNASFRHQLPVLADAGFRAVAPLLRGYEPSSQPSLDVAPYHPLQSVADVTEWAKQLGGGEPVHLVGHDWGAIIGFLACALHPEHFRSYCAIAVPHFQALEQGIRHYPVQLRNSWYTLFFQLRGVADAVLRARDFAFIEKLWRDWSPGWHWEPEEMEALKATFRQPGVARCALAYYRGMLNPFSEDSKQTRQLGERAVQVPTLAVTGARDGCMDTRIFDHMPDSLFTAGVTVERVPDAGHFVHQERPEEFNLLLLDWLRRN
jgi:pimeloyl-ACP methyl ester carboxylesterase